MGEYTYGQRAVGLDFEPCINPQLARAKQLFAEIIDLSVAHRSLTSSHEAARLFSIAITEAQGAHMWMEKAIIWSDVQLRKSV